MPVTRLPGVGKVKAAQLEKLGIGTVGDLLYHFPRGYQNRGDIRPLAEATMTNECCATVLTIGSAPHSVQLKNHRTLTKFSAFDGSGKCEIVFFNANFVRQIFLPGMTFRFWGKVTRARIGRGLEMISPAFEQFFESVPLPDYLPVYPLTEGLKQKALAGIIGVALTQYCSDPSLAEYDPIPASVREKEGLLSLREALPAMHCPQDYKELDIARSRFIFEELYLYSLGKGISSKTSRRLSVPAMPQTDLTPFKTLLPYQLTGAQERAVTEIAADLSGINRESPQPMKRLLSGDVGSGKTVCAAAAAYLAGKNGWQTAMMVPTEILAVQHYNELKPLLEKVGLTVELLTGSLTAAEKRRVRGETAAGRVDLLIGTHAILTGDTEFAALGLVITDEQHRFGVMQRAGLADKGRDVHTLVMTATPIPRTLALILYDDLDISRIDELPPGRTPVDTFVVDSSYRARLYAFIRKQAEEGHQTYIVCPAVESDEDEEEDEPPAGIIGIDYHPGEEKSGVLPLQSAVQYAKQLQEDVFPDLTVDLLHGKMKGSEKDKVMSKFVSGETQILVSTTVIEVGVNVPNATLMIVENAERFGLSQLHQLRGRVGRGKAKSYCILLSDTPKDSLAMERLQTLRDSSDGYEIAEADLRQRGPGDFLPSGDGEARQHGEVSFRIAGFAENTELLLRAAADAKAVLREDPQLNLPDNLPAARRVAALYTRRNNLIS